MPACAPGPLLPLQSCCLKQAAVDQLTFSPFVTPTVGPCSCSPPFLTFAQPEEGGCGSADLWTLCECPVHVVHVRGRGGAQPGGHAVGGCRGRNVGRKGERSGRAGVRVCVREQAGQECVAAAAAAAAVTQCDVVCSHVTLFASHRPAPAAFNSVCIAPTSLLPQRQGVPRVYGGAGAQLAGVAPGQLCEPAVRAAAGGSITGRGLVEARLAAVFWSCSSWCWLARAITLARCVLVSCMWRNCWWLGAGVE